jgi:class 3 adenylate cyclase
MRKFIFSFTIIVFSALLSLPLSAQPPDARDINPQITGIIINGDSAVHPVISAVSTRGSSRQKEIILRFRENNIIFRITPESGFEYQYFLSGFDKKPSLWQKISVKEYTNLPAGHYVFQTWFRNPGEKTGEMDPLNLTIKPLWYFSKLAFALYSILLLLLIWAFYEHLEFRYARKQYLLEQIINKRTEDLVIEKEKTEALLANVLPKNTADEIMAKGKATKAKYNFVTVLFSDIQGFTQIAEEMNPEVLIDELDKFFFHFDSVVEKYGIEKIKTIGDAYMCAGGIPIKNRTNPIEVILAGLEMQQYMKMLKESSLLQGMKYWDIRIGIHTGTVIAGVVGQKKLSYDIWGDTVNIASRMESSGEGGKINISGTTYEFVKDFFICEHRGKMPVKYKGELDMYFVSGIIPELSDEKGFPNTKFRFKMQIIKLEDVEEAVNKIFIDEAPPDLYFHNAQLARSITAQVELIATAEQMPEEEYINLKLASVFLITGYLADYDNPAEAAFSFMGEILPRFGFDESYIISTRHIITNSFNEKYESSADRILHDARYDYLGRIDYIKLTDKLMRERNEHGIITTSNAWIDNQKKLLRDHDFLTKTGKLLRSVTVEEQIAALLSLYK